MRITINFSSLYKMTLKLNVSEYYQLYENDFLDKISLAQQTENTQLQQELLTEANKCVSSTLQQMTSELATFPKSSRKQLAAKIAANKKTYQALEQKCNSQKQGLIQMGQDVMNNGDILNDIERMASETESLAVNVNNEMTSGTRALINSKKSSQELKNNVRKVDLTVNMFNRKMVMDKGTLYVIIFLLALIDVLALYMKLH